MARNFDVHVTVFSALPYMLLYLKTKAFNTVVGLQKRRPNDQIGRSNCEQFGSGQTAQLCALFRVWLVN